MPDPDAYITLIAGLPSPEALFQARRPPLSRLKLKQRLRALTPEDARTLKLVEDAIDWRSFPLSTTDQEVIDRGRVVMEEVPSRTLQLIVRDRLELRTFVAALRRRASGEAPPPADSAWGFGRWPAHIARHWTDPAFRLEGAYPWLREADRLIRSGEARSMERMLLDLSYRMVQRNSGRHVFDLEAVVIYVLKWNIVDRATRYNREAATRRFQDLVRSGLGEFAQLRFAEEN